MAAGAANLGGFSDWTFFDLFWLGICVLLAVMIGDLIARSSHRRLMNRAKPKPPKPKHQFTPKRCERRGE
jgi:hypothetical protein